MHRRPYAGRRERANLGDAEGGPNDACKVASQSLLMEGYAMPGVAVANVDQVSVAYAKNGEGIAPSVHVFVIDTDGNPFHLQQHAASPTGWTREKISIPGATALQVIGGSLNGTLWAFAIDSLKKVWRRKANPGKVENTQNFSDSLWVGINNFPTDGWRECISLGDDMRLYASYDKFSSSSDKVWQIMWMDKANWVQITTSHEHIYTCAGGWNGVDASVSNSKGDSYYARSYSPDGTTSVNLLNNTKHSYSQLVRSTIRKGDEASDNHDIYVKRSDGWLYYAWRKYGQNLSMLISKTNNVQDFTVSSNKITGEEAIIKVMNDGTLMVSVNNGGEFSPDIQIGSNVASVSSATVFVDKEPHSAIFYTTTDGELIELQQVSASDYQRTHVLLPKPVPTSSVPTQGQLITGMHRGVPSMFTIDSQNKHIHRYIKSNGIDLVQDLWVEEEFDLDEATNATVVQITTSTGKDGLLKLFARDIGGGIWKNEFGLGTTWIQLQPYPSNSINRKIVSGLIDGEVKLLAMFSVSGVGRGVKQIDIETGAWTTVTPLSYDAVYDVTFGTDLTLGDGFYVSYKTAYNFGYNFGIDFFLLDGSETPKKTVFSSPSMCIFALYGTPTGSLYGIGNSNYPKVILVGSSKDAQVMSPGRVKTMSVTTDEDGNSVVYSVDYTSSLPYMSTAASGLRLISSVGTRNMDACPGNQFIAGLTNSGSIPMRMYRGKFSQTYKPKTLVKHEKDSTPNPKFKAWITNYMTADVNECGVPGTTVYFRPVEDDVSFVMNGKVMTMTKDDSPQTMVTNSRGVASFTTIATSLHAPMFEIWTNYHDENSSSVIEPNGEDQLYLGSITDTQLQDAKMTGDNGEPGSGGDLFEDPSTVTPEFVNALHDTVNCTVRSDSIKKGFDLSHMTCRKSRTSVLHSTTRGKAGELRKLDPEVCAKTRFHVQYTKNENGKGRIKHEKLDASVTPESIIQKYGDRPVYVGTYADIMTSANLEPSAGIELEDTYFFGGSTQKARNPELLSLNLFDAIESVITFAIDGVKYIWKGFIQFVEEAMSAAQSLFSHVGVLFTNLYNWLASFFSWGDIIQTAITFEDVFTKMAVNADSIAAKSNSTMHRTVRAAQKSTTKPAPNEAMFTRTGNDSAKQANDDIQDPDQEFGYKGKSGQDTNKTPYGDDPQGNYLFDQFDIVSSTLNESDSFDGDINLVKELENIMTVLMNALVPSQETSNLDDLSDEVCQTGTGNSLGNMKDQAISMMKDTIWDAIDNVFDNALGVVGKALQGFIAILNRTIDVPFFSTLWKAIPGTTGDLSLMKLICLMLAVPTTMGWKLMSFVISKKLPYAPFVATAADIIDPLYQVLSFYDPSNITNTFDPENPDKVVLRDSKLSNAQKVTSNVFGYVYSFTYLFLGMVDWKEFQVGAVLSKAGNVGNEINRLLPFFSGMNALLGFFAQSFSVPFIITEGVHNAAEAFEAASWSWQWLFFVFDLGDAVLAGGKWDQKAILGTICGVVHTTLFYYLAIEDYDLLWTDTSTPNAFQKGLYSLKISQNFLTSFGECGLIGRSALGNAVPVPKVIGLVVGYEAVAFYLPAAISLTRSIMDSVDHAGHVVAN